MNRSLRSIATTAALGAALVAAGTLGPVGADGADSADGAGNRIGNSADGDQAPRAARTRTVAVGLTPSGVLVRFRVDNPDGATRVGAVSGLAPDAEIIGLDVRPLNGTAYVVGDRGGIYRLNLRTADASRVGQLTAPLDGDAFGVDVNPAADALRIVSDTGQNLRYSFAMRTTTVDTPLTTPPTPPDTESTPATGVTGVAYTNNDTSATTGTALFDISTALDAILLQVPANGGVLSLQAALGLRLSGDIGFDIASRTNRGTAVSNVGFLTSRDDSPRARLHRVDLLTGRTTPLGRFPARLRVSDLAVVTR